MAWIELHDTVRESHKIYQLMEKLKIKRRDAIGMVSMLWTWALTAAPDGNLTEFPLRALAEAVDWGKSPETLLNALIDSGWIDRDESEIFIHDWDEYTTMYQSQIERKKEKTRERVRQFRERERQLKGIIICSYCGGKATGVDHIISKAKGGSDSSDNTTPCCGKCNEFKGVKNLVDFLNSNRNRIDDELVLLNPKLMRYVTLDKENENRYVTICNTPTVPNLTNKEIYKENSDLSALQTVVQFYEQEIGIPAAKVVSDIQGYLMAGMKPNTIIPAIQETKAKYPTASWTQINRNIDQWQRNGWHLIDHDLLPYQLAEAMAEFIGTTKSEQELQEWARVFMDMHKSDPDRTGAEIVAAMEWAITGESWWAQNKIVLSADSLKNNWDKIRAQMGAEE
jgi:hypothetical protein